MKILIVEDDTLSRRILTRVLRAVGHDVTACPDAETAWDAQAANAHDIVVLDWMLPGMDGLEFCRRLRAQPKGDRVVVLVTTARTSADDFEQVLAAGADDYLAKPLDPELLGVRLRVAQKRVETLRKRWAAEDARERLEKQIVEAQKLESMAALAGGIAHDFNNMLLAIQGSAELLRHDLGGEKDPNLDRIDYATRRCAQLTGELLAYSGRGRFLACPVNLSDEARSVDAAVREGLDLDHRVLYELAEEMPPVEADPQQIRQVLAALLRNAVEALPADGGTVVVSSGVLDADEAYLTGTYGGTTLRSGAYAFVNVADTGHGMDAETLGKVFDPFFSTRSPGRGMGLAAALGIVRGHGGGIHMESVPGQGTDVRVLLPVSVGPADAPDATVAAAAQGPAAGARTGSAVLVVDDEPAVREVAGALLEDAGMEVFLADGGQEAVEALRENPQIALALVDLMMPGMDGVATVVALRALQPGLRALMSSGYAATEVAERLLASKPDGFLQKPYAPSDLVDTVRAMLPG